MSIVNVNIEFCLFFISQCLFIYSLAYSGICKSILFLSFFLFSLSLSLSLSFFYIDTQIYDKFNDTLESLIYILSCILYYSL